MMSRFTLYCSPLLITLILLLMIPSSVLASDKNKQQVQRLEQLIKKTYSNDGPGAAVLITSGNNTLLRKGFGQANIELNVPISADMIFNICSITKTMVTTAMLQLSEQKKLNLSDSLHHYLPEFPFKNKHITLEQMLSHRSGIHNYTDIDAFEHFIQHDVNENQIMTELVKEPLYFEPGDDWFYSNSNFFLSRLIIEKVSGLSFEEYIQRHIFEPAKMKHSSFHQREKIVIGRPSNYDETNSGIVRAVQLGTDPAGAGGIMSTVDDLFRFYKALNSGKLLSPTTLKVAYTQQKLNDGRLIPMGLGWFVGELQGETVIHHGGNHHGWRSNLLTIPEKDITVIILSNLMGKDLDTLGIQLLAETLGKPLILPKAIEVSIDELKKLEGEYKHEKWGARTLFVENGKLYSQRGKALKFQLIPIGKHEYIFEGDAYDRIKFNISQKDTIESLTLSLWRQLPAIYYRQ